MSDASAVGTAKGLSAEPLATLLKGPVSPLGSKRRVKVIVAVAPTARVSVPASRFWSRFPSKAAFAASVPDADATWIE